MSTQDIPTSTDWRAELQRLVQAYDDHGGKWPDEDVEALHNAFTRARTALAQPEPGVAEGRIAELEAGLERERLRLAACGVVAMADTPESAAKARDMHPDFRSASLDDVIRQSDALMTARAALSQIELTVPSDEQAENLAGELEIIGGYAEDEGGFYVCVSDLGLLARAAIARWGRHTSQEVLGDG